MVVLSAESHLVELMRKGMICKEALGWGSLCSEKQNPTALPSYWRAEAAPMEDSRKTELSKYWAI